MRQPAREKGVVLIVALVMLLIMTILGLTALKTSALEERMATHSFDRSLSFQAAEAALREAEEQIEGADPRPTPAAGNGCIEGHCGLLSPEQTPRWDDSTFTGWKLGKKVTSGGISITPKYFVEYMGNTFPCQPADPNADLTCKRYRITARSSPGDDRASVTLQSIYATE
jgi:type IV pilus assembly protein PilX